MLLTNSENYYMLNFINLDLLMIFLMMCLCLKLPQDTFGLLSINIWKQKMISHTIQIILE